MNRTLIVLLFAFLTLSSSSFAVILTDSSAALPWVPVLYAGNDDPSGDQQTGNGGNEADIVGDGDAGLAALYKAYYTDLGTGDTFFGARLRLGAQDNANTGYASAAIIGLDVNSDAILDFYIGVEVNGVGSGSDKFDIGIYQFPAGANSPENTSLASPSSQIFGYEQSSSNFDWSPVSDIDTGLDPSAYDIDQQGNPDYFLTVAVPFLDLQAAINGTAGYEDFSESTPISFVAITSQNLNQINNDFNGIDGSDDSLGTPYGGGVDEDGNPVPGAGSVPYSPESTEPLDVVPESSSYALIFGLFCLFSAIGSRSVGRR